MYGSSWAPAPEADRVDDEGPQHQVKNKRSARIPNVLRRGKGARPGTLK